MSDDEPPWWVYLLECSYGRIYTGVTPDLNKRIALHAHGRGALFTKINRPTRLLAAKPFSCKNEALQIEKQVKKAGAAEKRKLAALWSRQHPLAEDSASLIGS